MADEILDTSDISLLYPDEASLRAGPAGAVLAEHDALELEFDKLIDLKSCDLGEFFTADAEVIRYRQETFADMMRSPELSDVLRRMIPILGDITELRHLENDASLSAESYLYSITEVELYTTLLENLKTGLLSIEDRLESRAFRAFAARIRTLTQSEYYDRLNQKLGELTRRVREIKSVTIGVNLDARLRPDTAGLLAVNNEPFKSGEVLDKILRMDFKNDEMTCIAPLVPYRKTMTENAQTAMENALYGAIGDVFKTSIKAWKKIVQMYVLENTDFLLRMLPEIEFVTKATELLCRLRDRGCRLSTPTLAPKEEKKLSFKNLENPVVALKITGELVPNDITFDDDGMIYVLTGPNRGGKSVLTSGVGLATIMAQLGLPVTADEAVISPVDTVLTHFPTGSEDTIDKGRLGEECARIDAMFGKVTEQSLVLLDEALSSTGSYEGAYIAAEVLQGFSIARCRGIFSTHLHDLAADLDRLNESCRAAGGVAIDSLVAAMADGTRSFKIRRAKPDGKSYARDIAEKYGLSLPKILEKVGRGKED